MASNDQVDQDAIAAEWEASLNSEDPGAAATNELSGAMALQWAAMVEGGNGDFGGGKNGGERRPRQLRSACHERPYQIGTKALGSPEPAEAILRLLR